MERISEVGLSDRELELLLDLLIKAKLTTIQPEARVTLGEVFGKMTRVYMRFWKEYDFVERK